MINEVRYRKLYGKQIQALLEQSTGRRGSCRAPPVSSVARWTKSHKQPQIMNNAGLESRSFPNFNLAMFNDSAWFSMIQFTYLLCNQYLTSTIIIKMWCLRFDLRLFGFFANSMATPWIPTLVRVGSWRFLWWIHVDPEIHWYTLW